MSRTYRRTENGQMRDWLPGLHYPSHYLMRVPDLVRKRLDEIDVFLAMNPGRAKDIDDSFHWMKDPRWWRHDFHTVPARARTREQITGIMHGKLDPDDLVWPDGKKPKIWYW